MTSRSLGAILAAASVSVACFGDKGKPKQPPVPVAVTRAVHRNVPYDLTADGTVEPMQTAQVQAQVGGILTRVSFKEGDEVSEGQVLFQIEPAPYRAALDQASANLAKDVASYVYAKAEVDRYAELVKKDYATKEQYDQEVATAGSTAATVKADSAAVEQARVNLDWTTIRAPISGIAGQLLVKRGNLLRAGAAQPLVLINQIRPILVHFALPATSLPAIQQYASKGQLTVSVIPGMPPSATAQPTSNGPTPAYTTDAPPPTDDPQGQSVPMSNSSDGQVGGGGLPSSGSTGSDSQATTGRRGHRGGGGGSATGSPPGQSAGSTAGGTAGGTPGGPAAPSTDGPPNTTGGGGGAVGATAGATGGAAGGAAGGASGTGRPHMRGGAPDSAATTASGGQPRRPASMPGLPGVQAPARVQGTLYLIDNQVDTTTGTVLFKATFPNADKTLWPGQFVATTMRLFIEQNALVVPAQAVMMGQQGTYVYLVDNTGTARQRPVVVERTASNTAVIGSGLAEGDQVVTDGQSRLTPGAKVNIRGLVPAGAGGTTPGAGSSG
jgi:multidrug efflux pump subunit AcrA (membrane-fusion protein)